MQAKDHTPAGATKPRRKPKSKAKEEEEEEERRRAEELRLQEEKAALPPPPFVQLEGVWSMADREQQRARVGAILDLPDGPSVCLDAIKLDETYYDLLWAHEQGFSRFHAKAFHALMNELRAKVAEPGSTRELCTAFFRERVIALSSLSELPPVAEPPKPQVPVESESTLAADAKVSAAAAGRRSPTRQVSSKPKRPTPLHSSSSTSIQSSSSSSSSSSSGSTSAAAGASAAQPVTSSGADGVRRVPGSRRDREKEREADLEREREAELARQKEEEEKRKREEEEEEARKGRFDHLQVRQITDYVANGVLGHFTLYQTVFNPELYSPRKQIRQHSVLLESVIPTTEPLSDAIRVTELAEDGTPVKSAAAELESKSTESGVEAADQQQQVAPVASEDAQPQQQQPAIDLTPEMRRAVDVQVSGARQAMMSKLKENERVLEQRLKALESRARLSGPK